VFAHVRAHDNDDDERALIRDNARALSTAQRNKTTL
jgi:hypothetical protein